MNIENKEKVRLLLGELTVLEDIVANCEDDRSDAKFLFKYRTYDPKSLGFYGGKLYDMIVDTVKHRIEDIENELKEL